MFKQKIVSIWITIFFFNMPIMALVHSPALAAGSVVINEVMASNDGVLVDEDGDSSDWIELYNPTSQAIDLSGFMLSDKANLKSPWKFPQGASLASGQYLIVFADSKDRKVVGKNLHTDFSISSSGETVSVLNASAKVLDQVSTGNATKGQTLGRFPNGEGAFYTLNVPSPKLANSTAPLAPRPVFSVAGGFYNGSKTVALSVNQPGAEIQYTLFKGFDDVGEPIIQSGTYSGPLSIDKTTVVRAFSNVPGFQPSPMVSQSYFINFDRKNLPVVSIVTDRDNLLDPQKGIYVEGDGTNGGNFLVENEERPAYVEFYESNGSRAFGQNAGLRIAGNSSRKVLPRPLALVARSRYNDPGKFQYKIFPGKAMTEYDSFVLRNTNQDGPVLDFNGIPARGNFLRNNVMADLNRTLSVDFRDSRSVIVFIDGEFWGISSLQENYDTTYVATNHPSLNLDEAHIDLLKIVGRDLLPMNTRPDNEVITKDYFNRAIIEYENISVEAQGIDDFLGLMGYIQSKDMGNPEHYAYVKNRLNIQNTIDYFIAQIYSADVDWPDNNVRIWRDSRKGSNGLPGQWHYIYADSDLTLNVIPELTDHHNSLEHAYLNALEFKALLNNAEFKQQFLIKFAAALKVSFSTDNVLKIIDQHANALEPIIESHLNKWLGGQFTKGQWLSNVESMREFVRSRNEDLKRFTQQRFSLNDADFTNLTQASVVKTALVVAPTSTVTVAPVAAQTTVVPDAVVNSVVAVPNVLSAAFLPPPAPPAPSLVINEVMGSNTTIADDLGKTDSDWIEIKNNGTSAIDIKGFKIKDDGTVTWEFKESHIISAGQYLVIYATDNKDDGRQNDLHTNFKISGSGETITIFANDATTVIAKQATGSFTANTSNGLKKQTDGSYLWQTNLTPSKQVTNDTTNQSPVVQPLVRYSMTENMTFEVPVIATDEDKDPLTYTVSSVPAHNGKFTTNGNKIIFDHPAVNSYVVTVKVDDGKGHEVSQSFTMIVVNAQAGLNLKINEAMGANNGFKQSKLGKFSEWIEIKNNSSSPVDLSGFKLTDVLDGSKPGWVVPGGVQIAGQGHIIVWTTGTDGFQEGELYASFDLNETAGQSLKLMDASGAELDKIEDLGAFAVDKSRGRVPDGSGSWQAGDLSAVTFNASNGNANQVPVLSPMVRHSMTTADTIDIVVKATDPDQGDQLTYSVTSVPDLGAKLTMVANKVHIVKPDSGTYTVSVKVNDAHNADVSTGFTMIVVSPRVQPAELKINEVMGDNTKDSGIVDDEGKSSEWIEIKNVGSNSVDMTGFKLTDVNDGSKEPWVVPSATVVAPGSFLIIWASGSDKIGPELHADFGINKTTGEALILKDASDQVLDTVTTGAFAIPNKTHGLLRTPQGALIWSTVDADATFKKNNDVNQPPQVEDIANQNVTAGQSVDVTIKASDVDADPLSYAFESTPSNNLFTLTGNVLHLATKAGDASNYNLKITVNDGKGHPVVKTFTLSVAEIQNQQAPLLKINEVMGANSKLKDEDGDPSDWIEIKNIGTQKVNLKYFILSDNSSEWKFPAVSIEPNAYLIVWASSKNRVNGQLHSNFDVAVDNEVITIKDEKGTVLDVFTLRNLDTYKVDKTWGRSPDGIGVIVEFSVPTQDANNTPAGNQVPVIEDIASKKIGLNQVIDVPVIAVDADGDELSYSLDTSINEFTMNGNIIHLAPVNASVGVTSLTINVNDGHGHVASKTLVVTVSSTPVQISKVVINEAMGSNTNNSGIKDKDGASSDWFELKNIGNSAVDLKDFVIRDGSGNNQWTFPSRIIAPQGYLVVWASNKNDKGNELHTNFAIAAAGETLVLSDWQGIIQDEVITGPFANDVSRGRNPDGIGAWGNLPDPSLGRNNLEIDSPVIIENIEDQSFFAEGSWDVTVVASNKNGGSLNYELTSVPSNSRFTMSKATSTDGNRILLEPTADDIGTYALTVKVSDNNGNTASTTFALQIIENNKPPVLTVLKPQFMAAGDTLEISLIATDPDDGDVLSYDVSSKGDTFTHFTRNGAVIKLQPVAADVGTHTFIATVTDDLDQEDSKEFTLTISNAVAVNHPPEVAEIPTQTLVAGGESKEVVVKATDPDAGNTLTYDFVVNPPNSGFIKNNNVLRVFPLLSDAGKTYSVTVTVSDNGEPKQQVVRSFAVTIQAVTNENATIAIPTFNQADGLYHAPIKLELSSPASGLTFLYTLDGTDPVLGKATTYTGPITINKSMVVKARSITSQGLSPIVTKVYLINENTHGLGIVSLALNPASLTATAKVNLPSEIAFYDPNDNQPVTNRFSSSIQTTIIQGLKSSDPKSYSLNASNNAQFQLFVDHSLTRPRLLSLSRAIENNNSVGSALLSMMAKKANIDYTATRSVVAFVNGGYDGLLEMREQLDSDYFKFNLNLSSTDVDLVKVTATGTTAELGQVNEYNVLINFIKAKDFVQKKNERTNVLENADYETVKKMMNVDQFIKKTLLDIYLANTSLTTKNNWVWRRRSGDTRWSWIASNNDNVALLNNPVNHNTLVYAIENSEILKKLMNNQEFKATFIKQGSVFLNGAANPTELQASLDLMQQSLDAEMPNHLKQWPSSTLEEWKAKSDIARSFISKRSAVMLSQLVEYFNLLGTATIQINNANVNQGGVQIDNVNIETSQWNGTYFNGVPIILKAVPKVGYKFDRWMINGQAKQATELQINPTPGLLIEASFSPLAVEAEPSNSSGSIELVEDEVTTDADKPVDIDLFANDKNILNAGPRVISVTSMKNDPKILFYGMNPPRVKDGLINYDPRGKFDKLNFGQTEVDQLEYTVRTGLGVVLKGKIRINIKGLFKNQAPIANDDQAIANVNESIKIRLYDNDSDPDGDALDYKNVRNVKASGIKGALTVYDDYVQYRPMANFEYLLEGQTALDTFTYTIQDSKGSISRTATVTIMVRGVKPNVPVNHAPVAANDTAMTDSNKSITIPLFANDTDVDGDEIKYHSDDVTTLKGLRIIIVGGIIYTPGGRFSNLEAGQMAIDKFKYTITDSKGATASATVTIMVVGTKPRSN